MRLYNLYKRLGKNTILHFDNGGKYGVTFREIKIQYTGSEFRVILTDGYKDNLIGHTMSLKQAIKLGHNVLG